MARDTEDGRGSLCAKAQWRAAISSGYAEGNVIRKVMVPVSGGHEWGIIRLSMPVAFLYVIRKESG